MGPNPNHVFDPTSLEFSILCCPIHGTPRQPHDPFFF